MLRRLRESTFSKFAEAQGPVKYPSSHQPVLQVPKGGSSCANCEHLGRDGKTCVSPYYIQYMGTNRLPYPADQMCSDWWEGHG